MGYGRAAGEQFGHLDAEDVVEGVGPLDGEVLVCVFYLGQARRIRTVLPGLGVQRRRRREEAAGSAPVQPAPLMGDTLRRGSILHIPDETAGSGRRGGGKPRDVQDNEDADRNRKRPAAAPPGRQ